jgi:hypothetical protein
MAGYGVKLTWQFKSILVEEWNESNITMIIEKLGIMLHSQHVELNFQSYLTIQIMQF